MVNFLLFPDVRVRRMRAHHIGARGTLHAPQKAASLLPGTPEVLRQTTLQVHECNLRKPTAGATADASSQLDLEI